MSRIQDIVERIVRLHKFVLKSNCVIKYPTVIEDDKHTLNVTRDYVEFISKDSSSAYRKLILGSKTSNSTLHNNSNEHNTDAVSYLFRDTIGDEITIINDSLRTTINVPRFNANEEELLFTLSTITNSSISIVLTSVLMTLDTKLCTVYSLGLVEDDLESFENLISKAEEWIINYIQIH